MLPTIPCHTQVKTRYGNDISLNDGTSTSLPPISFIVCQQSISNINSFPETLSNSSFLLRIPKYSQTGAPEGITSQDLTAHPLSAVR